MMMSIKILLLWIPMILIAIANGTLRQFVLIKHFDESRAHQLSTFTLIIFCAVYTWFVMPYLDIQSPSRAFMTGLAWVVLTIAFEFILGRSTGKSWEYLLHDYNILAGRLWLLFLVCLLFMPYLFYLVQKK